MDELVKYDPKYPTVKTAIDFGVKCNTCFLGKACSVYKENSDCNLGIKVDMEKPENIMNFMQYMLKISAERIMRAYHFELTNGGVISKDLSEEMERFGDMVKQIKEVMDNRDSIMIKAKGKGIISQIFGGMIEGNKGV